jgi:Protein of unknown function (DUF4019)
MAKMHALFSLALVTLIALTVSPIRAGDADVKKLAGKVEKLLEAYNKDDVKAFFTGWASSVKSIATEATYDALYKKGAKKELGDYKAKTIKFRKEGSVVTGDFLVVYFEAEFSKEKAGLITVNFAKEDGEYKFLQVKMEKNKKN